MFDNLRHQSTEENAFEAGPPEVASTASRQTIQFQLALTPPQRFLLALMLFLNITVLGCFALLAFEKIVLPF